MKARSVQPLLAALSAIEPTLRLAPAATVVGQAEQDHLVAVSQVLQAALDRLPQGATIGQLCDATKGQLYWNDAVTAAARVLLAARAQEAAEARAREPMTLEAAERLTFAVQGTQGRRDMAFGDASTADLRAIESGLVYKCEAYGLEIFRQRLAAVRMVLASRVQEAA